MRRFILGEKSLEIAGYGYAGKYSSGEDYKIEVKIRPQQQSHGTPEDSALVLSITAFNCGLKDKIREFAHSLQCKEMLKAILEEKKERIEEIRNERKRLYEELKKLEEEVGDE